MSTGIRRTVLACVAASAVLSPATVVCETIVHEINTPFSTALVNPCTGEVVAIEGTLDTTVAVTPDESGGFHSKIHTASKGSGVAAVSSTRYVYSEEFDSEFTSAGATTQTQTLNHFLTSASATDNFFLKTTFHVTVNGTEVPTAFVDNFETGCRG